MRTTLELPLPRLSRGRFASIDAYTDEALFDSHRIRIAFTERGGGVSKDSYASLNLGSAVDDDLVSVEQNRRILTDAFSVNHAACLVPRQVHGKKVLVVPEGAQETIEDFRSRAQKGADALLIEAQQVAALLCFADCVPLIIVSPTGRFAVVHAGWRGVLAEIATKATSELTELDASDGASADPSAYNVYIGPYIHRECFETGEEVREDFAHTFGQGCLVDSSRIDLGMALRTSLTRFGVSEKRIADVDICTVCNNDRFFSYRAQEGICGRHGAFAVRM